MLTFPNHPFVTRVLMLLSLEPRMEIQDQEGPRYSQPVPL
jgi:hypothetical protein